MTAPLRTNNLITLGFLWATLSFFWGATSRPWGRLAAPRRSSRLVSRVSGTSVRWCESALWLKGGSCCQSNCCSCNRFTGIRYAPRRAGHPTLRWSDRACAGCGVAIKSKRTLRTRSPATPQDNCAIPAPGRSGRAYAPAAPASQPTESTKIPTPCWRYWPLQRQGPAKSAAID